MKQILLTALAVFVMTFGANAQIIHEDETDKPLIAADTAQQVQNIDKLRVQIKAGIGSYQKVVMDTDKEGHRWHFFKGRELKMVQLVNRNETSEMNVEWYFNNGQL